MHITYFQACSGHLCMDNISIIAVILCDSTRIVSKVQIFCICYLLMVANTYKHMAKVMIKILQGSTVT